MHVTPDDAHLDGIMNNAIIRNWQGNRHPKVAFQSLRLCIASAETRTVGPGRAFWVQAPAGMDRPRPILRQLK
ncbi:hypothetical protein BJX64DRAFT_269267 [Aspergillus heterothallicus]